LGAGVNGGSEEYLRKVDGYVSGTVPYWSNEIRSLVTFGLEWKHK
jgi:hypothetical protein